MSDHDSHDDHAHTTTAGYLAVFGALLILTVLTWVTAVFVDLGDAGNIGVALLIAFTKASLVLYFFMHLRESARIVKVTGITGFIFVGIMLLIFVTDFRSRDGKGHEEPPGQPWAATDLALPMEIEEVIQGPPEAHH